MVGAGTIINPILKVVTTVAILAAVYFFIVKPSLDTTERISSGINENSQNISESIRDSIQESQAGTNAQIDQALDQAERRSRTQESRETTARPTSSSAFRTPPATSTRSKPARGSTTARGGYQRALSVST